MTFNQILYCTKGTITITTMVIIHFFKLFCYKYWNKPFFCTDPETKYVWAVAAGDKNAECVPWIYGPGSLSDKALGYGLDGLVSIQDGGGVHFFTIYFVQTVLESTQPPVKLVPGQRRSSAELAVAANMWTLASTSPSWSVMGIP